MPENACIILAAGLGTRMHSAHPKVMHKVAGRTLIGHVIVAAKATGCGKMCVITGPDMKVVEDEARRWHPQASVALQKDRLGTAHAVKAAKDELAGFSGTVLILYGDVPLIEPDTLKKLAGQVNDQTPLAVLGFETDTPAGYGRLIMDVNQYLTAIREELDATAKERAVKTCNSGIMAVDSAHLWPMLEKIGNDNAKGEYYLTDLVGLTVSAGKQVAVTMCPESQVAGVNDRVQLAAIEQVFQSRYRDEVMRNGATLVAPETVFFSADSNIGEDVVIEPHVVFGPGVTVKRDAIIHSFCHLEECTIGEGAQIGPFARLRPGADLAEKAKVGNFVEIKKAQIGTGAKVNHLTYVGDALVGAKANIGAGVITCNYDGFDKHRTVIGDGAFIGSNSALVAPVAIGEGAYVGTGSVITKNVPPDSLAVARQRQSVREGWAASWRARHEAKK